MDFNYKLTMIQSAHDVSRRDIEELKKELKDREIEVETLKKNLDVRIL